MKALLDELIGVLHEVPEAPKRSIRRPIPEDADVYEGSDQSDSEVDDLHDAMDDDTLIGDLHGQSAARESIDSSSDSDSDSDSDSTDDSPAPPDPPPQKARGPIMRQYESSPYGIRVLERTRLLIIEILIFSFTKKVDYPFSHEILSFFAMMSWNFKMGVVKRPGQISQSYSAFIRTAQLILIEWAYQTSYNEIAEVFRTFKGAQTTSYRASVQDEHHQGAPSPPEFSVIHQDWQKTLIKTNKAVIHFMRAYFHHESSTSIGTLLAHRVLALAINKQETGVYHDIIPINNTTLMFKNITLSQEQLVQLFQKSILQAGHLLFDDLLVQKDWGLELGRTLTLPLATEGENLHQTARGWSFARSPALESFHDFLIRKILNNKAIREQWFTPSPIG
jgi:hypothetical protein